MSGLRINAEIMSLTIFWGVSILFLSVSIVLCFAIIVRRIHRNRSAKTRDNNKKAFEVQLSQALIEKEQAYSDLQWQNCHILDMIDVFLRYFRTLIGDKNVHLMEMIVGTPIEDQIIESTYSGVRGSRMAAVRTLSYLNSQKSLHVIFDNLSSDEKYVRLTAADCLVRRDGLLYLSAIVDSLSDAFPEDYKLLAGVLAKFGSDAVEALESELLSTDDPVVKSACLEALVMIMPPQTSLDLGALMQSPDKTVRAAALSLSTVAKHEDKSDPVRLGLKDETTMVKMRAVKIANDLKRADLTPELFRLSTDPVMWIRYWALRAIWGTGQSGEKFVLSLSETNPMAKQVAAEIRSGYV